ncbi:helix-turn-helix transcriptional regulator [Streptomyces sparsogenes]|uniref:helix-turn-helix transcriptional regulator n=1 Tax=Streptomyces sparsogenes TaxID=67365 RepID=UPI00384D3168
MSPSRPARSDTLTLVEVLAEIRMSRAAFYRMRARGLAPKCLKLPNGQIRVRRSDLNAWLEGCEVPAC